MNQPAKDQRLYLPELTEYRRAAAQRRAEAFCVVPRTVMGVRVHPVTPATFSALFAMRSPFVFKRSADAGDVAAFLWLHSPAYVHTGIQGWKRAKAAALAPYARALWPWWRRVTLRRAEQARAVAVVAMACAQIDEMIEEAFADAPAEAGRPQAPVATLEAFMIHEFAISYNWPPERTRGTALAQLMQLHRCIRIARGRDITDEKEDRIHAAHLRKRQDRIDAEKAAKGAPVEGVKA